MIEPLLDRIRRESQAEADQARREGRPAVLLAVHDWSTLHFDHPSKVDRAVLTHASDVGYDLKTTLIVRARDGEPIAPAEVALRTVDAVHSTREGAPPPPACHVDQLRDAMNDLRDRDLGPATLVHVVDREADSVGHWRDWTADGHLALVRGDDRRVLHQGVETSLFDLAAAMRSRRALHEAGPALYRGRPARRFVGETDVVLHRPAKRHTGATTALGGKQQITIPGPPVPLRLVVCEVRDAKTGTRTLARWLLLTNVPPTLADAATVAQWYYFRWRIESFHKLLKSSGWDLEGWLQRDGRKILHKLLLACAACASVWDLMRQTDASAADFRQLLMSLSGRQTKRSKPVTVPGLLAGLWVFQASLAPLARHGPEALQAMLKAHLPLFAGP